MRGLLGYRTRRLHGRVLTLPERGIDGRDQMPRNEAGSAWFRPYHPIRRAPTRSASGNHFECMLHFVGMKSMAIGGATPLGAMSNALTVAKGFVEGKGRNVVDWM
jgi:hypothetical protein